MKSQEYQKLQHEFAPVYDTNSRILILGSFPSVKSREQQFFYGHPQNRFWKVIAALTNRPLPQTIEEKKRLLLENRIAVWDVIAECEIVVKSWNFCPRTKSSLAITADALIPYRSNAART